MNQFNKSLPATRPGKSLSARAFRKTDRPNEKIIDCRKHAVRANTETLEEQTFVNTTKRHAELLSHTIRAFRKQKNQSSSLKGCEDLHVENVELKSKLNQLREQLTSQKTRRQQEAKGRSKLLSKTQIQFDNSGVNHVVEGVKVQYRKMKQMYEDKCKQCQAIWKQKDNCSIAELKAYCEELEHQNKKLATRLSLVKDAEVTLGEVSVERNISQLNGLKEISAAFADLQFRYQQEKKKKQALAERSKLLKKESKILAVQIETMQKLLLQKGNIIAAISKKEKQLGREVQEQQRNVAQLSQTIQQLKISNEKNVEDVLEREKRRLEKEKQIFMKCLLDKEAKLSDLTAQNKHLSSMLSGAHGNRWRKLQESTNLNEEGDRIESVPSQGFQKQIKTAAIHNRQRGRTKIDISLKYNEHPQDILRRTNQSLDEEWSNEGKSNYSGRKDVEGSLKHSTISKRRKRVKLTDLTFRDQLVYRFMAYGLDIERIKNYFDASQSSEESDMQKEEARKCYISMREIMVLLVAYPFHLSSNEAELLARYIIEDSSEEYPYCHEENKIERAIVKSIVKAFVGEYAIPNQVQCLQKWQMVLQKSGKNLRSALASLAADGTVANTKLQQICQSIQIELDSAVYNWLVSRLFVQGHGSLSKLNYACIFEAEWLNKESKSHPYFDSFV